jgi:hypothetical protein
VTAEVDLSGVDPSHRPGMAEDNLIPGLVYCMRCCRLLASEKRGLAKSGPVPCPGPGRMRPLEPIYDAITEPIKEN